MSATEAAISTTTPAGRPAARRAREILADPLAYAREHASP